MSPYPAARPDRECSAVRTDRVIALRRHNYGESSLVAHAMGSNKGRVEVLARGAYRATSRYAFALDLFDTLEWSWKPRSGALDLLVSGSVRVRRSKITRSLDAYRVALAMVELVDLATQAGQPELALFRRLERGLDEVEERVLHSQLPGPSLLRFDVGVLGDLGLTPAWRHCANCGREAPPAKESESGRFAPPAGGRLCRSCAEQWTASGRQVESLPAAVLELGADLASSDEATVRALPHETRAVLRRLLDALLTWHLERPPRSRERWKLDGRTAGTGSKAPQAR